MPRFSNSKPLRYLIYFLVLFIVQEVLFRYCFPLPELSNFDRITYMMWEKDKVGSYKHQRNQNWYWESQADTTHVFQYDMNLYGFRDNEWKIENTSGKPRVLFIGDSFIEGIMASKDETIPEGFKEASNNKFEVFNGGMMGTGIESYLQLFVDATPVFKPEYVVISISANDLGQKQPWIPETYLTPKHFNFWKPRLLESINQVKTETPIRFRWDESSKPYIPTIEAKNHPWNGKEDELNKHATPKMAAHMKNGEYSPFRVNNLHNEEQQLKLIPKLGDTFPFLADFCKKHGVKLIVIYIPSKNLVTNYYLPFEKECCLIKCNDSIDLTKDEYQIHQMVLANECKKNNIPFINLTPIVRAEEQKNNHLYWDYDDHMRGKGYLLLGESIYKEWIKIAN